MDRLKIERVGGFAGFGGPHLKSRGEVTLSDLSPADQQTMEQLFADPGKIPAAHPGQADAFTYKITRGARTIEVPEHAVPAAVRNSVKDVLE
ncbi:protealysin inhibitor emfourin [Bradyrhizobium arachidis]|uniref:Uncharacterized protein n=1 Tax=Bradyrhizobium arachidis TaxID=858423 RepID=A0AAE7NX95_9BRAD|nr:protealysin inhibitor emfourin [Bradyrhizobium arachidis]QOZ72887.1 hypothetical protein WN72_46415 [Bradyrhizobium arachidis]SFU36604.1 hypothetical protein SAMN05192541_101525 [Bradyrhizobium arachidis]